MRRRTGFFRWMGVGCFVVALLALVAWAGCGSDDAVGGGPSEESVSGGGATLEGEESGAGVRSSERGTGGATDSAPPGTGSTASGSSESEVDTDPDSSASQPTRPDRSRQEPAPSLEDESASSSADDGGPVEDSSGVCRGYCSRLQACGHTQDPFPSQADCVDTCRGWEDGPRLASWVCSELAAELDPNAPVGQEGCGTMDRCIPLQEELTPGARAYCRQVRALCGDWEILDIESQRLETCAWAVSGSAEQLGIDDLNDAAACVAEQEVCDGEGTAIIGCLAPEDPRCTGMCGKIDGCLNFPGAPRDDWDEEECRTLCNFGVLWDPPTTEELIACVERSPCPAIASCF